MKIDEVKIKGFRNFRDAAIRFNDSTLVIGANDVGKTNLVYALRLLLDKSLSERDIEPLETDFHIDHCGNPADHFSVTLFFKDIGDGIPRAELGGAISEEDTSVFKFSADRKTLKHKIHVGCSEEELIEAETRFYLRYVNMRYISSRRDLLKFINKEKRQLLKIAKQELLEMDKEKSEEDRIVLNNISLGLDKINQQVKELNYVRESTSLLNKELKKLSYHHKDYSVHLDSGAIEVQQFIHSLQLGASTSGSKLMLGGDGRNNQILLALWRVKSIREYDERKEVTFYCVEEPEAHLHPHQQRKLAEYLIDELGGQKIITTHSPQIVARFNPASMIRVVSDGGSSYAAGDGCNEQISEVWDRLGYRMSILQAESFFSDCVFLVEGPSELLFYTALSEELGINLDTLNISIVSVDGTYFKVYIDVLTALNIPWVLRTDNDVFKVASENEKQLAGVNRCMQLIGQDKLKNRSVDTTAQTIVSDGTWETVNTKLKGTGIYLAKGDLESDLALEMEAELKLFSSSNSVGEAIKYLKQKKATRMREFLLEHQPSLANLDGGVLALPLRRAEEIAKGH